MTDRLRVMLSSRRNMSILCSRQHLLITLVDKRAVLVEQGPQSVKVAICAGLPNVVDLRLRWRLVVAVLSGKFCTSRTGRSC